MYISKFKSDTAYGVEDINEITKILTGAGVVPSTPNDVLQNIAETGVTLSDMRCAVTFADETKSMVCIGTGTVIMPDGSYIVISNECLAVPTEGEGYVFVYNDPVLHNVPKCEKNLPSSGEGEYVLLAQIKNGTIYDKRVTSRSKIEGYGTNATLTTEHMSLKNGDTVTLAESNSGYKHVFVAVHNNGEAYDVSRGLPVFDLDSLSFPFSDEYGRVVYQYNGLSLYIVYENGGFVFTVMHTGVFDVKLIYS